MQRDACRVQGEICDIDGTCVDAGGDELFKLTTKEGKLTVETEKVSLLLHYVSKLNQKALCAGAVSDTCFQI